MRAWTFLLLAASVRVSRADELTQKMTARVSEEAEAFLKIAPEILGTAQIKRLIGLPTHNGGSTIRERVAR